jgi:hypothetical protein
MISFAAYHYMQIDLANDVLNQKNRDLNYLEKLSINFVLFLQAYQVDSCWQCRTKLSYSTRTKIALFTPLLFYTGPKQETKVIVN